MSSSVRLPDMDIWLFLEIDDDYLLSSLLFMRPSESVCLSSYLFILGPSRFPIVRIILSSMFPRLAFSEGGGR